MLFDSSCFVRALAACRMIACRVVAVCIVWLLGSAAPVAALTVEASAATAEAPASALEPAAEPIPAPIPATAHEALQLHVRLTGNWGWLAADLNDNPAQRGFTDDTVPDGASTWKFGYVVAQVQGEGRIGAGVLSCTVQAKFQERGNDPFTAQLREDVELDLGYCWYEIQSERGHTFRLAAGDKHYSYGLRPADVPLLDIFPERASVVYGESIRRRTTGGMVEFTFSPSLSRHQLDVVAYYVYDYLLGFGIQTQEGSDLDESHTQAYGVQLAWYLDSGVTLGLGVRQTADQSTEALLIGVPEQTEWIASAEYVRGPWAATWETVYSDSLAYNAVPGQLDEESFGTYVELSRSAGRWAFAIRGSYAYASQENPHRVDSRLEPFPGVISFLPFSFVPVRWELGLAVRYALAEQVHLKASVTTGDYGFLSDVAFTPDLQLQLFEDTGQDTHYSITLGIGLERAWRWLRRRD